MAGSQEGHAGVIAAYHLGCYGGEASAHPCGEGVRGEEERPSTQIPGCLWVLAREKRNGRFRDRCGQVLFVDTRRMGQMVDRVHRELTDEDIRKMVDTYHAWCGDPDAGQYQDVPGFC